MDAIVGEAGLAEEDRRALAFAERFEHEFINQEARRTLGETIAAGWGLMESLPREDLHRIGESTWAARQAERKKPS
jgi:V/A-type H+-transporting ATPase subunit B